MVTTTATGTPAKDLADALSRVAARPELTGHLHEILGAYCHQTRNLLNCLNMSLYLSRRVAGPDPDPAWAEVESRYHTVEQFLERIHTLCRPMSLSLVRLPLALLIDDRKAGWEDRLARVGRRLIVTPPADAVVGGFDPVRLGQGLDELVNWRALAGPSQADLRVGWDDANGSFRLTWDEPNRGRRAGARPADPGLSGPAEGSLTIPVLTRILSLHGGTLQETSDDGWRVVLSWPLDLRPQER